MELGDWVESIAKMLVEDPTQVEVRTVEQPNCVTVELHVAPSDLGRVIGKNGRTVRAIRGLVRAAGARQGKRVILEIV